MPQAISNDELIAFRDGNMLIFLASEFHAAASPALPPLTREEEESLEQALAAFKAQESIWSDTDRVFGEILDNREHIRSRARQETDPDKKAALEAGILDTDPAFDAAAYALNTAAIAAQNSHLQYYEHFAALLLAHAPVSSLQLGELEIVRTDNFFSEEYKNRNAPTLAAIFAPQPA